MDKNQAGQESTSKLFGKIIVLIVFVTIITSFIFYFNSSSPDMKYVAMENLQQRFSQSVTNSHWQWQAEGRPRMIVLVHYESRPDDNRQAVEKDRRPIEMGRNGYPKTIGSTEGCAKLWQTILNISMTVEGFKVYADYYSDSDPEDSIDDAKCRFRLSVGPYFDYQIANGHVSALKK
ncbi:hypothetical protein [Aliiglaciecola lipolytica]|uniref:MSHA biogenesis protein MshF n=1 Tax=Aliiglaciecola lipolytica E3 TaxID=1127673 RepID=K6YR74_9ALTE|nr:hypothetical protein [Aliiglaciecola lipolytica]GAC13785.1 hypothetical protein GLIP_1144 [Aliiglaciecola lipolytica E3]